MCREEEKTENHVFFKCKVAWRVWCMCSQWIMEKTMYHWDVRAHFLQFKLDWATQKVNRA